MQWKWILFAPLFLGLAACNTVEGFGQDVSAAGHAVEDTAEDTHTYGN